MASSKRSASRTSGSTRTKSGAKAEGLPPLGKNCSSGCPTRDHATWGECVRGKRLNLNPNLADTSAQKSWDRELDSYESAVRQGVQPDGTKQHQVDAAMRKAEASA